MFEFLKRKREQSKPPVPEWQPSIVQPVERIIDRVRFYTSGKNDIVAFACGTCVLADPGMTDEALRKYATEILQRVSYSHPDMTPQMMDDGNILIRYSEPAVNVVLGDISYDYWPEIERRHRQALLKDEVLITPLGANRFNSFGKKALFGRCFLFMDAVDPRIVGIERRDRLTT